MMILDLIFLEDGIKFYWNFRELIQKVQENSALKRNPDNLVIFVTPEFLFRPASGSYEGKVQMVIDYLLGLVKAAEFSNWLFFFGSIIGDWKGKKDRNIVPIISGGLNPKVVHIVVKQNTSGIDYIENRFLVKGRCPDHNAIPKPLQKECCTKWYPVRSVLIANIETMTIAEEGKEVTVTNETKHKGNIKFHEKEFAFDTKNNFFDYGGVSFCVEVCLDHDANDSGNGFARTTLQAEHLDNRRTPRSQIHLVTSCGMSITPSSVCASPGGLVAICDGISSLTEISEVKSNYTEFEPAPLSSLGRCQEEFNSLLPQTISETSGGSGAITIVDVVDEKFAEKKLYGRRVRADIYPAKKIPAKETIWNGS